MWPPAEVKPEHLERLVGVQTWDYMMKIEPYMGLMQKLRNHKAQTLDFSEGRWPANIPRMKKGTRRREEGKKKRKKEKLSTTPIPQELKSTKANLEKKIQRQKSSQDATAMNWSNHKGESRYKLWWFRGRWCHSWARSTQSRCSIF